MTPRLTVRLPRRVAAVRVVRPQAGSEPFAPAPGGGSPFEATAEQTQQRAQAELRELASARRALADGTGQLARLRQELIRQAEQQLLDLALDIARKVLAQEIQAQRYQIEPIVAEALRHAPCRQDVVVHLHPDDWARLDKARAGAEEADPGELRLVADPAVPPAGCLIETAQGVVESGVEGQLAGIAEALRATE